MFRKERLFENVRSKFESFSLHPKRRTQNCLFSCISLQRVPVICENLLHFGPQTAEITLLIFEFPLQLLHSVTGRTCTAWPDRNYIRIIVLVFFCLAWTISGHTTMKCDCITLQYTFVISSFIDPYFNSTAVCLFSSYLNQFQLSACTFISSNRLILNVKACRCDSL